MFMMNFVGILLYGPPGCAKTSLARALASSTKMTFFSVSAAELYSPFVGATEKSIVELFHRARIGAPSIVFIDEIGKLFFLSKLNHGSTTNLPLPSKIL